jgi:hypothetical protein
MDSPTMADNSAAASGMMGQPMPPSGEDSSASPSLSSNVADSAAAGEAQADAANLPAAGPRQAPPSPAALPPVHKPGVFDQILTALGGGPNKQVTIDPETGRRVVTETPPTRKQSTMKILAAALEGAAVGLQQHGPGNEARAAAAGVETGFSRADQANAALDKNAQQDFQRKQQLGKDQQEQQLKAAQIFETNQRAALTSRQSENAAEELRQKYIASSQPVLDAARSNEVNGQSTLKREHLTQAQLLAEHSKDGARHASTNVYIPDGEIAAIDPATGKEQKNADGSTKMEYTYSELDPGASVELDPAMLDQAVKNGMPVPGYTPGAGQKLSLPVGAAANLVHFNQGVDNFRGLVGEINSTLGLKKNDALDPEAMLQRNPALGAAVQQLAAHWNGVPSQLPAALQAMQAPVNGKPNPAAVAARTLATAIGGDRLDEFNEAVKGKATAAEDLPNERQKAGFQEAAADRNAQRSEARASKKEHAHDEDLVIAYDPGNDKNVVMAKGDLPRDAEGKLAQGWQHYPLKDPQQLAATVSRFNDVQTKVNQLAQFVQNGGMEHIQAGLVGDAIAELDKDLKVGAFGAQLPTARINALLDQENYKAMSEPSRQFVRAYGFAKEAMTQLPAIQTFGKSNRINDTQLKASLQLLPDARMAGNTQAAKDQMVALQQILDPLRKGIPEMPGAKLLPSFMEQGAQPSARPGANTQPGQKPDPFAAFGGRVRTPTAGAGTASQ